MVLENEEAREIQVAPLFLKANVNLVDTWVGSAVDLQIGPIGGIPMSIVLLRK